MYKVSNHNSIQQVLFDFVPYPFWVLDTSTFKFLAVNKAALNFYGYTEAEFLSMDVVKICPSVNVEMAKTFAAGVQQKHIINHLKMDGTLVTVEVSSVLFDFDGKPCLHQTITDISELQQANEKLRQSEAHFRSLVENSDDMIMRFDREFRHLYANPVTQKYIGIKAEDTLGKNHIELGFPKEQCDYWDGKINEVFETGRMMSIVSEENPANFCFHWDLIPEFDTQGNVVSVLSVTRDITEFVKAKSELAVKEKQLKEANDTQEKLQAIFSKDIRWPLIKSKA